MATASIPMPGMTLRLKITKPHGYRVRMAIMTWLLWLVGRVAPSNIDVHTEIVVD